MKRNSLTYGRNIVLLFILLLSHAAQAGNKTASAKDSVYLFTSFHEPSTEGLEYIYSYDCLHWDTVPNIVMRPEIGNDKPFTDMLTGERKWPKFGPEKRCLRDPSMVQGPDGTYHLVWTTQWGGNRSFGYAHSKDLVHWSEQREIPVMDSITTNNVWAPEIFYDDDYKLFFIIWSSQIKPDEYTALDSLGKNSPNRLWYTTTRDFVTFSKTQRYYDPQFNSIDAYLLKRAKDDYVLIVKDNRKPGYSNLFCVFGKSPYGPFGNPSERFGRTFSEGPCAMQMPGGEWLIYFDQYHPQEYTAVSTRDFKTFTPMRDKISVPVKHKHGTIVRISKKELDYILKVQKGK